MYFTLLGGKMVQRCQRKLDGILLILKDKYKVQTAVTTNSLISQCFHGSKISKDDRQTRGMFSLEGFTSRR